MWYVCAIEIKLLLLLLLHMGHRFETIQGSRLKITLLISYDIILPCWTMLRKYQQLKQCIQKQSTKNNYSIITNIITVSKLRISTILWVKLFWKQFKLDLISNHLKTTSELTLSQFESNL